MKKFIIIILSIVLILSFSLSVSAESVGESIEVFRNIIKLQVNGENVDADNFVLDGVAYIPLTRVGELLNKNVGWNTYTNVASIDDMNYELNSLSKLLPTVKGFEWIYEGFVEYGHKMKINSIVDENDHRDYNISGEVIDPSDGEGSLDSNIIIKYNISNNKLVQTKTENTMLDSKFDNITLIQTPLVEGTFWEENAVDKNGVKSIIHSYIEKIEISSDGKKEYIIRYDDVNSDYYEIRKMKEGIGVVSFEKLLELEDSSFPVSYFLFDGKDTDLKAEKIDVKLYFSDKNAEKLQLETRKLDVFGKGIARASILALIDGPTTDFSSPIPNGTKLLNIYIKNGTCFVDFSKEFISNHSGGSAGELMTLYSITNTLTEFKSITGVQILVEGKSGKTLGNVILDKPLKRDQNLIKK